MSTMGRASAGSLGRLPRHWARPTTKHAVDNPTPECSRISSPVSASTESRNRTPRAAGSARRSAKQPAGSGPGARPRHPAESPFAQFEGALHEQRKSRGRHGAREKRDAVVQREARRDTLAVAARTDESGDGRGADIDYGR